MTQRGVFHRVPQASPAAIPFLQPVLSYNTAIGARASIVLLAGKHEKRGGWDEMMGTAINFVRPLHFMRALTPAMLWLVPARRAFGQNEMEGAAALGACATCSGVMLLIPIGILAINIYLLVWVSKDAKARGLDNSVLWMIVVLVFSLAGLVVYLLSRPKGELMACSTCGNKRLQTSARCPSCGNA